MHVYVAGKSAYLIWRGTDLREVGENALVSIPADHVPRITKDELGTLGETYGIELPLQVGVATSKNRRNSKKLHCVCNDATSASHQYLEVEPGLFVARPEVCLMQMASECSPAELAYYAGELCGAYGLEPQDYHRRGFITSPYAIEQYLSKSAGCHGHKKLERVLYYIPFMSCDPVETVLALLLCLPRTMGGYGLPMPQLNMELSLSDARREEVVRPDLLWEDEKVIIEFDGAPWHVDEDGRPVDARRRNLFFNAGYRVYSMTMDQMLALASMDDFASVLAGKLGAKKPDLGYKAMEKRILLRRELFVASELRD